MRETLANPVVSLRVTTNTQQLSCLACVQYRGGAISVAEFMREALTNPVGGFYSSRGGSAIGARGHFVTSPEISPLFGDVRCCSLLRSAAELNPSSVFSSTPVPCSAARLPLKTQSACCLCGFYCKRGVPLAARVFSRRCAHPAMPLCSRRFD